MYRDGNWYIPATVSPFNATTTTMGKNTPTEDPLYLTGYQSRCSWWRCSTAEASVDPENFVWIWGPPPFSSALGSFEGSLLHVVNMLLKIRMRGKKFERLSTYLSHPKETSVRLYKEAIQIIGWLDPTDFSVLPNLCHSCDFGGGLIGLGKKE